MVTALRRLLDGLKRFDGWLSEIRERCPDCGYPYTGGHDYVHEHWLKERR